MDGLPTRLNLAKRGLNIETKCPLCENVLESTSHALIYCDKLCDVWWSWQACLINLLAGNISFVDGALEILDAGTLQGLETFFATAWSIWYNWNQVIHESSVIPSSQIWNIARCAQEDYKGVVAYNCNGDSVVVVEVINANNCNGDIGPVIQGTLELLRHFRSWKVRHLKRDYNKAAHDLAQVAKANGTSQQWKGMELPMIQQILLVDRAKC